jgi:hypothetical protein
VGEKRGVREAGVEARVRSAVSGMVLDTGVRGAGEKRGVRHGEEAWVRSAVSEARVRSAVSGMVLDTGVRGAGEKRGVRHGARHGCQRRG